MDGTWHCAGVEGITYSEGRLEVAVCDASFRTLGDEIEDGGARSLRSCTGRGGDCYQREELLADWKAFAQGRVDKVEEIGVYCG